RPVTGTGAALVQAFPKLSLIGILAMEQAPGDSSMWYVARKPGYVYRFSNNDGVTSKSTVLTLTDRVQSASEGGLLGMAFHPQFRANGHLFLFYTRKGAPLISYLSRFTSTNGGATFSPSSEKVLLTLDQATEFHHGGGLAFGPDGYLYIGIGDAGIGSNAQNVNVLLGKILRIDVDRGASYAIPSSNPFAGGGGKPEIYALGLRNPWRLSFDRGTGELWAGDVGKDNWEEVNRIERGGNYGWAIREGAHCFGSSSCRTSGLIEPVHEYSHAEGSCVIGGYVYRGTAVPGLQGTYIFGDWGSGKIWGLSMSSSGQPSVRLLVESGLRLHSFAEGADGEVYVLSGEKIHRFIPGAGGGVQGTFPQKLSETGLFDSRDTRLPGPCLIPYDVNAPLWSDGADKDRWMAVPDGKRINIRPDGDWDFPIGTVLVKSFKLSGKLIETRLLMRHDDGEWAGYSYEWDSLSRDATLLPDSKTKSTGGTTWTFPGRAQCLQCHTAAAGRVLGLETAQLNRPFRYPSTGRTANQLATLEHIGLFSTALPGSPASLPVLSALTDGSQTAAARARAYLHSNCSHCHRPDGGGRSSADLRYTTPEAEMNICNTIPIAGDLGVTGARLLVPRNPARSLVSLRMHATDLARMPPLARNMVDTAASAVIDEWIAAKASCAPAPPPGPSPGGDIVLDDGAPGTSSTGTWNPSGGLNPYGPRSIYSKSAGATYTFRPPLPGPGEYAVDLWWTQYSSRPTNVPIEIAHASGTATVTINQRTAGGRWNRMGSWSFGSSARITVRSLGGGSTCADAVRLVPLEVGAPPAPTPSDLVLDDGDRGTTAIGDWRTSGAPSPHGSKSLYSKSTSASYSYSFDLPQPDEYDVELWWTEYSSRPGAAPVDITHASGTATIHVNQRSNGGRWNKVGRWSFSSRAVIRIRSLGGDSTCADAVRLVPVES
ncbi:MAG TPA: PQQ-dependent sugar dehydrogenase, partial [Planctomycetota bacterium]|nr:PQQ-dependent sugar dehydrogenase [Planctomycetota bacterium]